MSNVVNKITLQYLQYVNTPDYDPAYWLINPDLSAVQNVSQQYWKLVPGGPDGYTVAEMTAGEKAVVDAAIAAAVIPRMTSDYYQSVRDDTESSTTSNDWVTKLTMTTRSLPAGKYVITWSALCSTSTPNKDTHVAVVVDGYFLFDKVSTFSKSAVDNVVSGAMEITLSSGVHTILMQYKADNGNTTSLIRKTSLLIWRV